MIRPPDTSDQQGFARAVIALARTGTARLAVLAALALLLAAVATALAAPTVQDIEAAVPGDTGYRAAAIVPGDAAHRADGPAARTVHALDFVPTDFVGGAFTGIAIDDADPSRAYATRGVFLEVYDLADPHAPVLLGRSAPLPLPWGRTPVVKAASGGLAYIVGTGRIGSYYSGPFSSVVTVVDATDPVAPTVRGAVTVSGDSVTDVVVRGDLMYVTTNPSPPFEDGLLVVDVADPDDPQLAANIDVGDPASCVAAVGDLLLVGVSQTAAGGVVVLDAADPRAPRPVGRLVVGDYAVAVGGAGVYGLLVTYDRVRVLDLTDPTNPRVVSDVEAHYGQDLAVGISVAYVIQSSMFGGDEFNNHLLLLDTSNMPALSAGGTMDLPTRQRSWLSPAIAATRDLLLVADIHAGLRVVGPAVPPTAPLVEHTRLRTIGEPTGLAAHGGHAYVVDYDDELWVLALDKPDGPRVVGMADLERPGDDPHSGGSVSVADGLAYVTHAPTFVQFSNTVIAPGALQVFDVTIPERPRQVGVWDPRDDATDPALRDMPITNGYAPVVSGDRVLLTGHPAVTELYVTPPETPRLARTYGTDYSIGSHLQVGGAALDAPELWLATGAGLELLDVDPASGGEIERLAHIPAVGAAKDVAVAGETLAVGAGTDGLVLVDRTGRDVVGVVPGISADRVVMHGSSAIVIGPAIKHSHGDPHLWAVDVAEPAEPIVRGSHQVTYPFYPWVPPAAMAEAGDRLLLASGRAGVQVLRLVEGGPLPTITPTPSVTPTPSITPTPTITPTPVVSGGVALSLAAIQGGCQDIRLTGAFTATSLAGAVREMRTALGQQRGCNWGAAEIGSAEWTPFTATEAYTVSGGAHVFWTTLGVQYRDDQRNVSPYYCAEIQGVCLGTPTPSPRPPPTPTADGSTSGRVYLPMVGA